MGEDYSEPQEPTTYSVQTLIQEGRRKRIGKIEVAASQVQETIETGNAKSREQAIIYLLREKGIRPSVREVNKATQEFRRQYNLWQRSLGIDR